MKTVNKIIAFALTLCLCTLMSACGDVETGSSKSQKNPNRKTEINLKQLESFIPVLWDTDIAAAGEKMSEELGINTDNVEVYDSGDDKKPGTPGAVYQSYTYDLTNTSTEVMGVPCKEIYTFATYVRGHEDDVKDVEYISFVFDNSSDKACDKLSKKLTKAYGEGTKETIPEFVSWTPSGKKMKVEIQPPVEGKPDLTLVIYQREN